MRRRKEEKIKKNKVVLVLGRCWHLFIHEEEKRRSNIVFENSKKISCRNISIACVMTNDLLEARPKK
jgi:hypothetical protein